MNYNVKNNIISLIVACGIILISFGIFIAFVNSDEATNSDIKTSNTKDNKSVEAKYYTISDGRILDSQGKVDSDVAKNFRDIEVYGAVKDNDGVLDFNMAYDSGNNDIGIKVKYRAPEDENNDKEYFSSNEITMEKSKQYRVDGGIGQDASFQGYVYYYENNDSTEEKKELCTYLKSDSYFEMVSCEDEKNVYTTIKTSGSLDSGSIDTIRNNALYKFDKKTHQTKKICNLNIHEDEIYIHDIACNDDYIYVLVSKSSELYVKVFSKESGTEKNEASVEVKENLEEFAAKRVKEYSVREIDNYEIIDDGYELFASDDGLVIVNKLVVAEIESKSNKHYGEKGYNDSFEEKGLEPYVNDVYKVSSFTLDGKDVGFDSAYICESDFMFDFAYFKDGVIYILTNEKDVNANLKEKIRVTAVESGNLLDQIYININTLTGKTGNKELKYVGIK